MIETIKTYLKNRIKDCEDRIEKGQGTWPEPNYIKDSIWQAWFTEKHTLEGVLEIIEREQGRA